MKELSEKDCVQGDKRLEGQALTNLLAQLGGDWQLVAERRLRKSFSFDDFASALAYVNRLGEMAEQQNHHPELALRWGQVTVEIWTHSANGLTEADFVFASKAESLR